MDNSAEQNTSINKLGNDVVIDGEISFKGNLEFDGKLNGKIDSDGILIIGKNGDVQGKIKTDSTTIFGKAGGEIITTSRCELKSTGAVNGNIETSLFSMDEGSEFSGNLNTSVKR